MILLSSNRRDILLSSSICQAAHACFAIPSLGQGLVDFSSKPEIDEQNDEKRGHNKPRDHNDFDSDVANRGNVVVDVGNPLSIFCLHVR